MYEKTKDCDRTPLTGSSVLDLPGAPYSIKGTPEPQPQKEAGTASPQYAALGLHTH